MATRSQPLIEALVAILTWFKRHKVGIEAAAKTLAIVGAAVTFVASEASKYYERDAKRAVETYQYMLKYSKESESRTPLVTSSRLKPYFDTKTEVPVAVMLELISSKDPNDIELRRHLIAYVNHCEGIALARNNGVFHKRIFDAQLSTILTEDYRILRQFLILSGKKGATYREWKDALKEWKEPGADELPG